MTDRDMSHDLDGMFSDRNAGQLVSVKQTRTRVMRSPGLRPAARMAGGDIRNLTPAIGRPMFARANRNLTPAMARSINARGPKNMGLPMFKVPGDLADDLGTITLPMIGTVSLMTVAIGVAAGYLGYKMFKKA